MPEDKAKRLEQTKVWLDPKSDDFMGTGMNLEDLTLSGTADQISRSYVMQDPVERRRRLQAVIQLSHALFEIRKETIFATRLAESAIGDVLMGDWAMVREWLKQFTFSDESGSWAQGQAKTYKPFLTALRESLPTEETET